MQLLLCVIIVLCSARGVTLVSLPGSFLADCQSGLTTLGICDVDTDCPLNAVCSLITGRCQCNFGFFFNTDLGFCSPTSITCQFPLVFGNDGINGITTSTTTITTTTTLTKSSVGTATPTITITISTSTSTSTSTNPIDNYCHCPAGYCLDCNGYNCNAPICSISADCPAPNQDCIQNCCQCIANFVWDLTHLACVPGCQTNTDCTSTVPFSHCAGCNAAAGTTHAHRCECNAGFQWDATFTTCVLSTAPTTVPTTTVSKPFCWPPCLNNGVCVYNGVCDCPVDTFGSRCQILPSCRRGCPWGYQCVASDVCCPNGWTIAVDVWEIPVPHKASAVWWKSQQPPSCNVPICDPPCIDDTVCTAPNICQDALQSTLPTTTASVVDR